MRKKITIIVLIIVLFAILIRISQVFFSFDSKTDNLEVKKGKDIFSYRYYESFSGNRWDLYINDNKVYSYSPWADEEEMKKYLEEDANAAKTLVEKESVKVYAIVSDTDENQYCIIYSVDGEEYSDWKEDVDYIKKASEEDYFKEIKQKKEKSYEYEKNLFKKTKRNLKKLYEYISEDELKKVSEESWE